MPVHAVRSAGGKIIGYRWGSRGKIYKTKGEAEAQGRAIRASGWKEDDGLSIWEDVPTADSRTTA